MTAVTLVFIVFNAIIDPGDRAVKDVDYGGAWCSGSRYSGECACHSDHNIGDYVTCYDCSGDCGYGTQRGNSELW